MTVLKNSFCQSSFDGKHRWYHARLYKYCLWCSELQTEYAQKHAKHLDTRKGSPGERKRQRLRELYGDQCFVCGGLFDREDDPPTIEHVIPKAWGGSNRLENLRLSHLSCNWQRGEDMNAGKNMFGEMPEPG